MSLCIPTPADVTRLLGVLEAYGRDAVWLRVWHVYHLGPQPDQICFDVVDENGTVLRDRSGRTQRQTWQALTPNLSVACGDQVYVCREGKGVRVRFVPLVPGLQVEKSFSENQWRLVPLEMSGLIATAEL